MNPNYLSIQLGAKSNKKLSSKKVSTSHTFWQDHAWYFLGFSEVKMRFCHYTQGTFESWKWHGSQNLMLFDVLTSPQGDQFDPRMKILLAFCSACHPRRFDMPHDHVWFFWPPGHPQRPKVPPLWHDPGDWMNIPSYMFCIFHLWEHTHSLV